MKNAITTPVLEFFIQPQLNVSSKPSFMGSYLKSDKRATWYNKLFNFKQVPTEQHLRTIKDDQGEWLVFMKDENGNIIYNKTKIVLFLLGTGLILGLIIYCVIRKNKKTYVKYKSK